MQNIKLLVFDIDGTLIYHRDGDVLLSTKEAIKLAHQRDIHTIIATGRCPYFISEDVKNTFKDADYFITMNGTLIVDNKMNTIIPMEIQYITSSSAINNTLCFMTLLKIRIMSYINTRTAPLTNASNKKTASTIIFWLILFEQPS